MSKLEKRYSITINLPTNHALFFSAGTVELIEETDDGRMAIMVAFETRLKLKEERQTLPFNIWTCEPYEDDKIEDVDSEGLSLKQGHEKIMQTLISHKPWQC